MKLRVLLLWVPLALLATTLGPTRALAAEHGSEQRDVREPPISSEQALRAASIARQTMSPFCPGRTLADCPSEYATEWRRDIRAMVARGLGAEEIQRELSSRAGGDLSGIPHREVTYGLPLALAAGALLFIGLVFLRLRGGKQDAVALSKPAEGAVPTEASGVDDERLAAELEAEDDD